MASILAQNNLYRKYTVSMEEETTLPPKMINPQDVHPVDSNILQLLKKAESCEASPKARLFCGANDGAGSEERLFCGANDGAGSEASPKSTGITTFGNGMILVHPDQFYYVLYKENSSCWKETEIESHKNKLMGLELINTDSLEVKGMLEMEVFKPAQKYAVYFWLQMKENAKFDTLCRFTLVVAYRPDALVLAWTHDLKKLKPNTLQKVKVGEFTAKPEKGPVRFSLINFDPNWKSGMILVGVYFQPIA